MVGQAKAQTAADILRGALGDIAMASAMPDADPQFFTQLQQAITNYLRKSGQPTGPQPGQGPNAQPGQGMGQPSGAPQPAPNMPPRPGMGGGFGGASVTGGMSAPPGSAQSPGGPQGMPNADELRRLLSQGAPGGQGGR